MKSKLAMVAVLAGLTLSAAPRDAYAQGRKPVETRGAVSRGGTTDPNIKKDEHVNAKAGAKMAAPEAKGGTKTRSAAMVGPLHVDNRTDLFIRIYVDGEYRGYMSPWGDWHSHGGCNSYTLYAVAVFDDGSRRTWGPVVTNGDCSSQKWTLR